MAKTTPWGQESSIDFWLRQTGTRRLRRREAALRAHVLSARHADRTARRRLLTLRIELADRGVRLPELAE